MKAIIKAAVMAGIALALPLSAFAATISNPLFSNGDTTIDANGNSTVSGTFTLQVASNEVCEVLRTQADPSRPFTDSQVGGSLGYQYGTYTNVPFTVKVPPNTGTYYPTVQCAGIWGGNHSVDGNDNVVVGPMNLGTLRVVANGSTGSSSGDPVVGTDDFWTKMTALFASLTAALKPATPTHPAYCAGLATYSGLYQGMQGGQVQALQSVLIGNGFSIPAGATGYYGVQTSAAHTAAKAACM